MVYPIVRYGQPVLEKKAEPVTEFDTPELHQLVEDMFESMYAAKGVGLAAPQIGVGETDRRDRYLRTARIAAQKLVLINPEIIGKEGSQTRRGGLPEPSDVSRAGDAGAEGHGARERRHGQSVRDDRRGSAGAGVSA